VIRTDDRDGMMNHLKKVGIGTGIHYPIPLHLQKAYAALGYRRGDFPVCEKLAADIVSLPMYPQLTTEQQAQIVGEILYFVELASASKQPTAEAVSVVATERRA
jgi:dTDP-4-amino-4,6-dideoxygalactose transaminase